VFLLPIGVLEVGKSKIKSKSKGGENIAIIVENKIQKRARGSSTY
jgi:hypothetical protein